jgi:hypothetical protein
MRGIDPRRRTRAESAPVRAESVTQIWWTDASGRTHRSDYVRSLGGRSRPAEPVLMRADDLIRPAKYTLRASLAVPVKTRSLKREYKPPYNGLRFQRSRAQISAFKLKP